MPIPHLPAETLDHIVDCLHDTKRALMVCCLVSKSWIPRARKHLFADVQFHREEDLQLWKETFPDLSTSPARYATDFFIGCSYSVTPADVDEGGWLRGFSRVVHLGVDGFGSASRVLYTSFPTPDRLSLVPLHGFSPAVKSLPVFATPLSPQVFDLIFSFPLLEDLTVIASSGWADESGGPNRSPTTTQPSNSPAFTGSLKLSRAGIKYVPRPLLSLPGGIHFRELSFTWRREEAPLAIALVEGCSRTLQSLIVSDGLDAGQSSLSVDLSKAVKLRDAVFRLKALRIEWVATITPEHQDFREISICVRSVDSNLTKTGVDVRQAVGEQTLGE